MNYGDPNDLALQKLQAQSAVATTPILKSALFDYSQRPQTNPNIKKVLELLLDTQKMSQVKNAAGKSMQGSAITPEELAVLSNYTGENMDNMAMAGVTKKVPRKISTLQGAVDINKIIENVLSGRFGTR